MTYRATLLAVSAALAVAVFVATARADGPAYVLAIHDHRFEPPLLHVPANTKVKLVIRNADPASEEFDSAQLRREKVIPGGGEATLYIGPLPPGTYEFIGEFHPDTARGRIVVR